MEKLHRCDIEIGQQETVCLIIKISNYHKQTGDGWHEPRVGPEVDVAGFQVQFECGGDCYSLHEVENFKQQHIEDWVSKHRCDFVEWYQDMKRAEYEAYKADRAEEKLDERHYEDCL